jgi:predicted ATPase
LGERLRAIAFASRLVSPVLVGRERERTALLTAYGDASREAIVVLVGGEAGMGKTRLVREFTSGLGASARTVTGGCTDLGADGPPFGAFVTALRRLVRAMGVPAAADLLPSGGRRGLARLLPERGDDGGDPDRARLFDEILLLLLEGSATDRPLVVVLEDLHWADRSTGELLAFLAQNLSGPGLLLVGTYRPDEIIATHPPAATGHPRRECTPGRADRAGPRRGGAAGRCAARARARRTAGGPDLPPERRKPAFRRGGGGRWRRPR